MKNLRGVLGGLLIFVVFQLTLVSCTDSNEIIKSQDESTEIQKAGHGEVGDPPPDEQYEQG